MNRRVGMVFYGVFSRRPRSTPVFSWAESDGYERQGLDLVAPRHARVSATAPGRVVRSEPSGAYGQLVEIEHASHYITRYAHLDRRDVAVGDVVQRGQAVGMLGNTGRSTGPHLHYEILYKNQAVNPETPLQALWQDRH